VAPHPAVAYPMPQPAPQVIAEIPGPMCDCGINLDEFSSRLARLEKRMCYTDVCGATGLRNAGKSGFIAGADFLYWTLRHPGAQYAIRENNAQVAGGDQGAQGQVIAIGGDYAPGYRVSAGYRMGDGCGCISCGSGMEFLATYTNWDNFTTETSTGNLRATSVSAQNADDDDADNNSGNTADDFATRATAELAFDYETIDCVMAQNLIMSNFLTLRLKAGGRYAKVDSMYHVTYEGGDFNGPTGSLMETDFEGGGFLMGLESRWMLNPYWSFDVGATGVMMMGEVKTRSFYLDDDDAAGDTNVSYRETRVTPVFEAAAAVRYRRPLYGMELTFSAGYEMVHWFNLAETRNFTNAHQESNNTHLLQDFTLDGLFARAGINY